MKKNILILISLIFAAGYAKAGDTLFLKGMVKLYKNSFFLRWNSTQADGFAALQKSTLNIDIYEGEFGESKKIQSLQIKPKTQEEWKLAMQGASDNFKMGYGAAYNLLNMKSNQTEFPAALEAENDRQSMWGFASLAADREKKCAQALNLGYLHTSRNLLSKYAVHVYFSNCPGNYISDTLHFFIFPNEISPAADIAIDKITEDENAVAIDWSFNKTFTSYLIKKENKNGISRILTPQGLLLPTRQGTMHFNDSVSNYSRARYSLLGIDAFGDTVESKGIWAMGRDRTPPLAPKDVKANVVDQKNVFISWNYLDEKDIAKIEVLESELQEGWFKNIATLVKKPNYLNYLQKNGAVGLSGKYYQVRFYDTAGNYSFRSVYCNFPDEMPPAVPQNVKAVVNEKGIVSITWKPNTEADFDGYLLYTANDTNAEFTGLINAPTRDTFFSDTLSLKMLNKQVFYKVVAADIYFNRSKPSKAVKVLRPDTLAPVPPLFTKFIATDSGIHLYWNNSSSFDVLKNNLYRINPKTKEKTLLISSLKNNYYFDHKTEKEIVYEYYLNAEDDSKNISPNSTPFYIQMVNSKILPQLNFTVTAADTAKKTVTLGWNKPAIKNNIALVNYTIYYAKDGVNFRVLKVLPPEALSYTDKYKTTGKRCYAIMAQFADGYQSKLSNAACPVK